MKIVFERETYNRMIGFTKLADTEVAGMARVEPRGNNIYVYDLRLIKNQKVTNGNVNIEIDDIGKFISTLPNPHEFKFLWHSHCNMGAFLSGIDEQFIEKFLLTGDFLISCVTNKKEDIFIRLDTKIIGIRLSVEVDYEIEDDINYHELEKELKENIIEDQGWYKQSFNQQWQGWDRWYRQGFFWHNQKNEDNE